MRAFLWLWVLLSAFCHGAAAQEVGSADRLAEAVASRLADYLDAFNSGDAEAVGSFWAPEAVWLDEATGEQATGRDAVVAGFRELFAETPGARLGGRVDQVRTLRPEVAIAEGTVTFFSPGAEPTPSAFTAVLVLEEGEWLIESSQERPLPNPSPGEALQSLEWLIGEWRDETADVDVNTSVRWSMNRTFLLRSFRADFGDDTPFEGTQIIGWDPRAKQYRTWTFNSDGSFGEGSVSRNGDGWTVRLVHTRGDGSLSTETQTIERLDADTLRIERIGETAGGVPLAPGEPVTVVRQRAAGVSSTDPGVGP